MWWLMVALACGPGRGVARGDKALRAGDLVHAERRYRRVLDRHPEDVGALYGMGWLFHLSGDSGRAREYFKRCVRVAPEDYRGYRGLGSVALSEGNFVQAQDAFEDALERAPDEPRVLNSLGLVRLAAEENEAALALFEQAVALEPERGEYAYNRADALYRMDRSEEALSVIEEGLSHRIDEVRFRALLLELRALVLVRMTSGRVDPEDCKGTAPPVLAWLDAADASLDQAEALQVDLPNLPTARRRVYIRRGKVTETCPLAQLD